ncbi:ROK family transcriptional regulator [Nonomuraea soli]|uniref:Putative NBD/HSP70 family sugar kinase n=1 Tax=Nonomuraea soli TaxID=1032476 RepID=A0A7W0CNU8_9ACTN|nr:ROK family transcriptional regulator [Nonomuraea soli]MBA2894591.1 putative NBD/HSP70 family sugar kinase [Nonomuraea soli]
MHALPSGSPGVLRSLNERSVVAHLVDAAPLTRVDLAERTGLALPTVSRAVANLERAGLVTAVGHDTSRKGPAAALYDVRPAGGGAGLSVVISPVRLQVSLISLRGERLALVEREPEPLPAGAPLAQQIGALARRAFAQAGGGPEQVWHTVVAVPTIVDAAGYLHRDLPSPLPDFHQDAVVRILAITGGASTVENDINLAALGEGARGAARGLEQYVYLWVARSVAMGIVLGGRVHRGSRGAAGEISRMPIGDGDPADPALWESGPLHHAVSEAALRERTGMDAEELFAAAARGDGRAGELVAGLARYLARAVASIVPVLDPELVVLGGTVGGRPELLEPLRAELATLARLVPAVTRSALGEEAVLIGAEEVALRSLREELFQRVAG